MLSLSGLPHMRPWRRLDSKPPLGLLKQALRRLFRSFSAAVGRQLELCRLPRSHMPDFCSPRWLVKTPCPCLECRKRHEFTWNNQKKRSKDMFQERFLHILRPDACLGHVLLYLETSTSLFRSPGEAFALESSLLTRSSRPLDFTFADDRFARLRFEAWAWACELVLTLYYDVVIQEKTARTHIDFCVLDKIYYHTGKRPMEKDTPKAWNFYSGMTVDMVLKSVKAQPTTEEAKNRLDGCEQCEM